MLFSEPFLFVDIYFIICKLLEIGLFSDSVREALGKVNKFIERKNHPESAKNLLHMRQTVKQVILMSITKISKF